MNTPKTYLNSIRLRIVVTLMAFIAVSAVTYYLSNICRTKLELFFVGAFYTCVLVATSLVLGISFGEAAKWRKLLVLTISLFLSAMMCQNTEAVAMYPAYPLFSAQSQPPAVQKHDRNEGGQPKVTLCELLAALIVIGVGAIIVYNLRKCALKLLYPPCGNPPTNCPPGSITNGDDSGNIMVHLKLGYVRPMNVVTADSSQIGWDTTVAGSNWNDWTGSPVTGSFGGSITNMSDSNNLACYFQSSPNLGAWKPESLCVTGWVSETPLGTNVTEIVYDESGNAFETNWIKAGQRIQFGSMPVRTGEPAMYFKISP